MSDDLKARFTPSRGMGLKLLLVCGLALVMTVPALFVFGLLWDRTHRAGQVTDEIGAMVGGPQTFLGPVIAVPWRSPAPKAGDKEDTGLAVIFPQTGSADVATRTELRRRSLFSVPVYTADLGFKGRFDLARAEGAAPPNAVLDWGHAEFLVGVSDPRGARSDMRLSIGGKTLGLAPAATVGEFELQGIPSADSTLGLSEAYSRGVGVADGKQHLFGAPLAAFGADLKAAPFEVTGAAAFTGARQIGVLAFARTTTVTVRGDWGSPSFAGAYLPGDRHVAGDPAARGIAKGFSATWTVPYVARGVPDQGGPELLGRLGATEMTVSFVEPANPYQSVGRALKYALLFVGMVFLAYFVFETTSGKRMHAAQYVLVGLAQVIFYLLLLSIAEQLGFDAGFLIAASATVLLISVYASWVFGGLWRFIVSLILFSGLYGLIYVLMRLEDYALLVGAVASFAAIALVMYFTRRIDWYGVRQVQVQGSEG